MLYDGDGGNDEYECNEGYDEDNGDDYDYGASMLMMIRAIMV